MEGHAKKCVERHRESANKTTQQLYKVSTPCVDDHQFKEEEMKSVGELSSTCSQIVLKCLYLARIGLEDLKFYGQWTNLQEPSQNGPMLVTNDCLVWSLTFLIRVNTNILSCGNTAKQCRLGLFQDSDFAGDLEDSVYIRWNIVHFWKSYVCSNQLDV